MFSRIKEAIRIITYREPDQGPDAVIVERKAQAPTGAGKGISHFLEFMFALFVLARVAGIISERLERLIPATHSVSITTLAGAVGILLTVVVYMLKNDIEAKIRTRINLAEILAPYFGHRLDSTIRVLKG